MRRGIRATLGGPEGGVPTYIRQIVTTRLLMGGHFDRGLLYHCSFVRRGGLRENRRKIIK